MKLKNNDPTKPDVHVLIANKQINVKDGFVVLVKPNHAGFNTIRKDAFKHMYNVPKNLQFSN